MCLEHIPHVRVDTRSWQMESCISQYMYKKQFLGLYAISMFVRNKVAVVR